MIGYVTLGTNDLPRAAKFYDELLSVIGAGRFMEEESFVAWSTDPKYAPLRKRVRAPGTSVPGALFYCG